MDPLKSQGEEKPQIHTDEAQMLTDEILPVCICDLFWLWPAKISKALL